MLLPSLIRTVPLASSVPSPEDIFTSTLGLIFTDDLHNQHGDDPSTLLVYKSRRHGDVELSVTDPAGEEQRRKFAHYLWNAGVLMGELVGGRPAPHVEDLDGREVAWWVRADEEERWSVERHAVLELGAGV